MDGRRKGLDKFRDMMFKSQNIVKIKWYPDASSIFPTTDIKGGVQLIYLDDLKNDFLDINSIKIDLNSLESLPTNLESFSLISKIEKSNSLSSICRTRSTYPIRTNSELLQDSKIEETDLLCYVSQQKGFTKYVPLDTITRNQSTILEYKVFTARAAGKGGDGFGNIFKGLPGEVSTDSYISFKVNSETEADNLVIYLKTKFANFLLSLRKNTQDIKPDTCKYIPLVDLSISWTDEMLYKEFNLTQEEINLIEGVK